jgi:ATP synthase protein I
VVGVLAKWAVVVVVLGLVVGVGGLPPVAAMTGVIVALVTQMLAMASR